MSVYKRGKTYWYEFVFAGRRIRASAKTGNRRTAEQIEAAKKTQLAKREVGLDVTKISVLSLKDAIAQYLDWSKTEHALRSATTARYVTASKALVQFFGTRPLDQITPEDVERFKVWRVAQRKKAPARKLAKNKSATSVKPIKPATVNRELACLKSMFNLFIKSDVVARNPVSRVKFLQEDNENFVVLTREEEIRYLLAASQPLEDVAVLMLETGCRPDEIYSLRKDHVNLDDNYLAIEFGKTKSARRRIPLTLRAKNVLTKRISDNTVFLFAGGRRVSTPYKPIVKLNSAHNGAVKRAAIRSFRLYDLRHTFASRMAMAGVDLVTLAAILGHSRIQMVLRYAHPVEEHKIDAIRKLQEYTGARGAA